MRVGDILSNYQQQGASVRSQLRLNRRTRQAPQTAALLFDSVDFDEKSMAKIELPEWLVAYIKLIPPDLAFEKTEKAFNQTESKVELLINKIIFCSL